MKPNIRKKIVYVDDVNYSLITVRDRLKSRYEVFPAQSAGKLFEVLEYVMPDLILLDVNMPDVDGYETIRLLKEDPRYAVIPVIFLTSQMDRDSVVKGINLGATAHVGKPYSTQSLIDAIENALNPNRQRTLASEKPDNRPSVLAVDDVSSMLLAINYALCDKYKVYTLAKPEELRAVLNKITPDLFLLDYNMPVINGFDLIPVIRSFEKHKETPVIFLTSEGTTDHLTAAIHLGASDFLVKPFETRALHEKVEKHIRKA
ncbi:MAG: response regulator [Oscillospiraceae bacterium]|nr:response regulator [Oscillospiraceae bacterium]